MRPLMLLATAVSASASAQTTTTCPAGKTPCADHPTRCCSPPPPPAPTWSVPRLHWHTSQDRGQGDPTGPIKIGSTWHMFVDGCGGWCHATSDDGAVTWKDSTALHLNRGGHGGIGTGSWGMLPNGTAIGLYCAAGPSCPNLECIGLATSNDPTLVEVQDHGVKIRMPTNLTGFRDPARAFVSADGARICAIIGAGAHDCAAGGAKWLQFCTKDLINLYEWELVSELGSQFTKSNKPSGGEVEGVHDDGCNGLVSCPDFFPLGDNSSGVQRWMLMGSYNTYRNSWFPPSRYSIGTFDGVRYEPVSQGILGGDSDYVPKSGADESNHGRRFLWSNIGGSSVLGHSGYLSLARELSLAHDYTLTTTFIPELTKLRIPTSHQTLASGSERVGDTLLLAGRGSAHMEVRLMIGAAHVSPFASTDAFGIAVKSQAAASGTYLLESTRIGISPKLRTLFIDRSYANANGTGWPQTGASDKRMADQPIMSYPLEISEGEAMEMVVIVDGGIVEVCANNHSVVAALALSGSGNSTRVGIFGLPSTVKVHAEAWELTPLYSGAQ